MENGSLFHGAFGEHETAWLVVKTFGFEKAIPDIDRCMRRYEPGGLAYGDSGPSGAIFHNDHLPLTSVSAVTIGRIVLPMPKALFHLVGFVSRRLSSRPREEPS